MACDLAYARCKKLLKLCTADPRQSLVVFVQVEKHMIVFRVATSCPNVMSVDIDAWQARFSVVPIWSVSGPRTNPCQLPSASRSRYRSSEFRDGSAELAETSLLGICAEWTNCISTFHLRAAERCGIFRMPAVETGRRHVATLMRRMGIEAIYRKPNTSKSAPGH